MDFPLFRLGPTTFEVGSLVKLAVLLALVFTLEFYLRRFFVLRVLRRSRLEASVQFAVAKIIRYAFLVLGAYVSLHMVGVDLSSLAFVAGALGVGLGFGLQNIVSNFVSGLIILMERPIALGDRIEINHVSGRVTEINLRSTTVITSDNISIIVPNSDLITHTVVNWSHGDPRVRIRLSIGVAYQTDIEKLRRLLLEVAARNPDLLADPAPELLLVGFGDSTLNFELAVWSTAAVDKPLRLKSDIYYALEKTLRENQIEMPFPQRDLHIRSGALIYQGTPPASAQVTESVR